MNPTKKKRIAFAVVVILLVALLLYYLHIEREGHKGPLTLYGNVDIRQANLGFRVGGKLEKMYFEEGEVVTKGTLLAELDPVPYEELLSQAKGRLDSVQFQLVYAEIQHKRRDELVASQSISEEDYQQALYNYKVLVSNQAEAQAAYDSYQTQLNDTKLYNSTDGTVLTRILEPGTIVRVGDPVYSISILSPVWVRAFVPEKDLGRIYPGMPAEVLTDTPTNPVYKGHIGFISPVAEFTPKSVETTQLRTDLVYQVRVVVDNPDRGLRQGMPVTVHLIEK